ncbi:uncharacterized protein LOC130743933 [Lotus japonicus]|uniref:uncharacterized protein LOC130743933 n=1 Tax=Lotus japonicus TaxID=34305 RepID=UPI00258A2F86|nr:uncharacterized protein LOC130743933 [Lotus japonicus]
MRILAWNCRGLGSILAVRALGRLIQSEAPDIVFAMETKWYESEAQRHRGLGGLPNVFPVQCAGQGHSRAGGLCLFWGPAVDVTIISSSLNHIYFTATHVEEQKVMQILGIYGFPDERRRVDTWGLVKRLLVDTAIPALCVGDFNDCLSPQDKLGGDPLDLQHIQRMARVRTECNLQEVDFTEYRYTWSNNREAPYTIEERLDYALTNDTWDESWPSTVVHHLPRYKSDHNPILLTCGVRRNRQEMGRAKIFRFEEMWLQEGQECAEIVTETWCRLRNDLPTKIAEVGGALKCWGKDKFGDIPRKISDQKALLQDLQRKDQTAEVLSAASVAEKELDSLLEQEEKWWRQRSRATWIEETTSLIANRLSDSHLQVLADPFTKEDVEEALFQMHPTKAPGADGFLALFYQRFWDVIGDDVAEFCLQILHGHVSPGIINHTMIVLIPKVKKAVNATQFRPISLCTVMFKIVTKVIANMLKIILPDLICESQSAFVPGRIITDNALIAYECFHFMKKRTNGRNGTMALKLDMSKAYDRIEWSFLSSVMTSMGFPHNWVNLIMSCVSTVSFSIMLNGNPQENFVPNRGLRQGDPLSPYLFILCGEVFSALINRSIASKALSGIKIARNAPVISHLLFVDDSILFGRATVQEAECLKEILVTYERASGQVVNLDKSMLSVSRNVQQTSFDELKQLLGVKAVESYDKYLGLPTIIGKSKRQIFNFVKERVWKKLKGWKEKFLSRAGREVLIKSVAQAIPSYVMSCFLLPDGLCADINSMISNFFWGGDVSQKGMHWTKWNKLCKNKLEGGLGFRDFKAFNIALVAKNWWRIYSNPEALVARVFKGVYFQSGDMWGAKKGYRPSYAWSSIQKSAWVFQRGGLWRIGNGKRINLWTDNWLPGGAPTLFRQDVVDELNIQVVSDLLEPDTSRWHSELVEHIFHPGTARRIMGVPLATQARDDFLCWPFTMDGRYSVKTGYHFVCTAWEGDVASSSSQTSLSKQQWQKFRGSSALPRCKEMAWRLIRGFVPVNSKLKRRHMEVDEQCVWCYQENETLEHVFLSCTAAKMFWFCSPLALRTDQFTGLIDLWVAVLHDGDADFIGMVQTLCYALWEARNRCRFDHKCFSPLEAVQRLQRLLSPSRVDTPAPPSRTVQHTTWRRPGRGVFMINFDATFVEGQPSGYGMVARNFEGEILASATAYPVASLSPLLAEAGFFRLALCFAIELGFRRVEFQNDCLQLFNWWKSRREGVSFLATTVRECRFLISGFDVFTLSFVRRSGNAAADYLARNASTYADMVWVEEVPDCVFHVVAQDVLAPMLPDA